VELATWRGVRFGRAEVFEIKFALAVSAAHFVFLFVALVLAKLWGLR